MKKLVTTLVLLCLFTIQVTAEDPSVDFNIESLRHENQLNDSVAYFHLALKGLDQTQAFVKVNNNSAIEQKFEIEFNIARTNQNGLVVFDKESYGPNDTLKYNIEEHVQIINPEIIVPAYSSGIFTLMFNTSNIESINDILMGALTIKKSEVKSESEGLTHMFQFETPLIISDSHDQSLYESRNLGMENVAVDLLNGKKVVQYEIHNYESRLSGKLNISSKLIHLEKNKVILNENVESFNIAPNGILFQYLDFGKKDVNHGKYKLIVEANTELNNWEWEYEFEIEKEESKYLNKNTEFKIKIPKYMIIFSIVLLIITILITVRLALREYE